MVTEWAPRPLEPEPSTVVTAEFVSPPSPTASFFPLQIEPPRASPLAVWVWILAVFALTPVLGVPVAVALAVCSLLLVLRGGRLPWDRRVGLTGLAISLAALAALGLWLVMMVLRHPLEFTAPQEFQPPAERPWQVTVTQLAVLVVSIMLHECAHAVSGYWSGDGTAARLGRISLNPFRHVDLFGSIILPAILIMTPGGVVFGWAKPVPVDRRQFRDPRRGWLAVTLAGVSVNWLLAMGCAAGLLFLGSALRLMYPDATSQGFSNVFAVAMLQGVPGHFGWELAITALKAGILVNLVLFTFNVLPIPPLDGFGVLESLAPPSFAPLLVKLRAVGWIVLLVLIVSGILSYVLIPGIAVAAILNLVAGLMTGWA
jgi:Zn-dependent protease